MKKPSERAGESVLPLGVFGRIALQHDFARAREELLAHVDEIPSEERPAIVRYLRGCVMIIPIMEHTQDVIGRAFGTPGGCAIISDGEYYWRLDAADYVEHYGIGLLEPFLRRGRSRAWAPETLTEEEELRIYHQLVKPKSQP